MALIRSNAGLGGVPFLEPMKCIFQKNGDTSFTVKNITSGTALVLSNEMHGGILFANITGFNGTVSFTGLTGDYSIGGVKDNTTTNISNGADVSNYDYIVMSCATTVNINSLTVTFTAT